MCRALGGAALDSRRKGALEPHIVGNGGSSYGLGRDLVPSARRAETGPAMGHLPPPPPHPSPVCIRIFRKSEFPQISARLAQGP